MKVTLTEAGLTVDKFRCRNVTVYAYPNGVYKAVLFQIEGVTETRYRKTTYGMKPYTIRLKKTICHRSFKYTGLQLIGCGSGSIGGFKSGKYLHAVNKKGEYVNYYEMLENEKT